jgi:hypothetical protein
MTGIDIVLAVVAVAGGLACLVAVLRMTSWIGRLGLLLVLLLALLVCLGVPLPTWQQIADYLAPTPTEVNR